MSGADSNQFRLCGELVSLDSLRHTPAGIPVLHCRIRHGSIQREAGFDRRVEMELEARAIGPLTQELARLKPGSVCCISGFLAKKSVNSQQLMLHICSVATI